MNPSEIEAKPVPANNPESHRPRIRFRWRRWLILLVVAGAVVWFLAARTDSPQARLEREVRRILAPVRKQDRSSFNVYSIAQAMYQWPKPFPKLAEWLAGRNEWTADPSEELAALGSPVVPILTNLLARDRSAEVRSTAAEALGAMGASTVVPQLLAAFGKERQVNVQSSILRALGQIGDERGEAFLISLLQGTNDSSVRVTAANALTSFPSDQVLMVLTNALLADTDWNVRVSIASGLNHSSEAAVQPALLTALKSDAFASVRQTAARTLGTFTDDATTEALLLALREDPDTREVRRAALDALRGRTNAAVRAAMLEVLGQNEPELRYAAAGALDNFPGPDTESALLELLSDSAPHVRKTVVTTLGTLAASQTNRALLPTLITFLQTDPEPDVRAAAATAISRIGGDEVVEALRAVLEKEREGHVQVEAIGGIYRHQGRETTALLLQLLNDSSLTTEARVEVIRCFGVTRDPSTTPRLAALLAQDSEENVREAAADALGSLDDTNAVAALQVAMQKDAYPMVRDSAAAALGGMRSAQTAPVLSALVMAMQQDRENSVRMAAATSLGRLRATNALTPMLATLQSDPDHVLRASAATSLGKLGCAEAIPALETAYRKDRHREVRANALGSLGVLAGATRTEFFLEAFERDRASRAVLARILGRIGSPSAVSVLRVALDDGGWLDQSAIIAALGDAGDALAVPPLIELLAKNRNPTTRAAAATALGCLCNSEAVPALEAALADRTSSVRQEAAWALGHIGDARAVAALSRTLNDRDSSVRFAAAFALAEVGERTAAPALELLLTDHDERARLAGASALAFLDNAQGLRILNATLHSRETWQRFAALISLLRLNTPAARQSLTDSHDADPTLAALVEAGLRLGGTGAATHLLATAHDDDSMMDDYRHFGARTLVLFNDPATLPTLQTYANDPEHDVRSAVRVATRRIQKQINR
jgi:HEAT repeat protein